MGAMAGGFGTTTEAMVQAGNHVLAVNEAVQSDLAALRGQIGPLAGAWTGDAARTFVELMARWDADAKALSEALRGIGESIGGSAQLYQGQEDQQASEMSAIRSALG
jgi:WXG100 family type VII secretion target